MASNNGISCDGVEKATRCQCKKAGCIKNGGGKCKCAKTGEFCGDQCLCKGNCHNTPEGLNGTRGVKRLNSGGVIGGKRQKTSGGPGSPFGGRSRTSSTGVHIVIRGPSAASGTIDHHPHPQHHHLQSMEQQQQQQQQQAYNPFHHHHHPHHANGQHFGEVGAAAASSSSALVTSSSSSTTSGAGGGGMDEYEPPTPQSKEKECDYCGVVGQRTGMVRCKRCKSAYYCDEKCESAAADNHAPQCYPRVMPKSVIGLKRHLQELGFVGEPSMCVMAGLVNGTLPKVLRPEDLDRKWWPKEWVRGCEWVEQFDVSSLDSSDELNSADDVDHDEVANAPPGGTAASADALCALELYFTRAIMVVGTTMRSNMVPAVCVVHLSDFTSPISAMVRPLSIVVNFIIIAPNAVCLASVLATTEKPTVANVSPITTAVW
eukprot:CAMPEP_0201550032 /NCGR_PEP_ID=MMETSP0173_2-20130828/6452_1 /ASSEMBLY_ACC=CAM_ASM_000268 /TAXON_ID=218659 /ORGANISM="Vexillifera sp., Strain DIVA3 564/2" /LENGTH=430 /DNA_ID=CAMNT_0047959905 /DNA_START=104 /DNA_END=1394 /DNA_ORIENTATION=-